MSQKSVNNSSIATRTHTDSQNPSSILNEAPLWVPQDTGRQSHCPLAVWVGEWATGGSPTSSHPGQGSTESFPLREEEARAVRVEAREAPGFTLDFSCWFEI